ncbi:hypothetical protein C8F01DRAFT_536532 [Mycena amicta]|nr:hypothetical protein C8F01DRAFT_536532 [Mycena amicta]
MPASRTNASSSSSSGSHACSFSGCNKRFSTSGHLTRHLRVHTGEMNFQCGFPGCQTRCSRQDNLRQHYRLHFDVRDPDELRRQAPHKKRRKTRVQRVSSLDAAHTHVLDSPARIETQSSSASSSSSRSSPYQVSLDLMHDFPDELPYRDTRASPIYANQDPALYLPPPPQTTNFFEASSTVRYFAHATVAPSYPYSSYNDYYLSPAPGACHWYPAESREIGEGVYIR